MHEQKDHSYAQAILDYVLSHNDIKDDALTKGRVQSIFLQVNLGHKSIHEVADYFGIPPKVVKGIAEGKLGRSATHDLL